MDLVALDADLGLEQALLSFDLYSAAPTTAQERSMLAVQDTTWHHHEPVGSLDLSVCATQLGGAVVPPGSGSQLSKPLLLPGGCDLLVGLLTGQHARSSGATTPGSSLALVGTASTGVPIAHKLELDMPQIADIKLVAPDLAVVAAGVMVCLVHVSSAAAVPPRDTAPLQLGPVIGTSADDIREVAVGAAHAIAFGGYAEQLHIIHPGGGSGGSPVPAAALPAGGIVSSVRWDPAQQDVLSWTTERGTLHFHDVRTPGGAGGSRGAGGAGRWSSGGHEVFTHVYHGAHGVVVAGAGGAVDMLDRRMLKERNCKALASFCDPLLHDIGDIEVHAPSGRAIMSGRSGFSVWDIGMDRHAVLHRFVGGHGHSAAAGAAAAAAAEGDDDMGAGGDASALYEGCMLAGADQLYYASVCSGSSVVQLFQL